MGTSFTIYIGLLLSVVLIFFVLSLVNYFLEAESKKESEVKLYLYYSPESDEIMTRRTKRVPCYSFVSKARNTEFVFIGEV